MQCRCEAESGVIVPGVLVRTHRDPSPLFEPVEAPLHDIAAPIALALVFTEVDRPARASAVSTMNVRAAASAKVKAPSRPIADILILRSSLPTFPFDSLS